MEDVVVVTGFGPFGEHSCNASWEAVRRISSTRIEREYGVRIVAEEIPVVYDVVDETVPRLWDVHNPMLCIHVGVSRCAKTITLESVACSNGYYRLDCEKRLPCNGKNYCSSAIGDEECTRIACDLDLERICNTLNGTLDDVKACISHDAGRYLCEYIYFTSLSRDPSRTLFVHVPDIDKPYSSSQTARGLETIIELCISELRNKRTS